MAIEMHGVVGRAAGRQQADNCVDDGFFADHVRDRPVVVPESSKLQHLLGGSFGQFVPQRRVRVDEGTAGQVQAP